MHDEASSYEQISDDQEGHGFHRCNGSRAENRVVASFDEQRLLLVREFSACAAPAECWTVV